jgi:hypothetical protein
LADPDEDRIQPDQTRPLLLVIRSAPQSLAEVPSADLFYNAAETSRVSAVRLGRRETA